MLFPVRTLPYQLPAPLQRGDETIPSNPVADWVSEASWQELVLLSKHTEFQGLAQEIQSLPKRWRDWAQLPKPEAMQLPGGDERPCMVEGSEGGSGVWLWMATCVGDTD